LLQRANKKERAMNQLDEIPLSEILLIDPWSAAKKGTEPQS
jgi:hypothetical protein